MPCSPQLTSQGTAGTGSDWEPALSQLRDLARPDLDRLVRSWLKGLELSNIHACTWPTEPLTYHALLPFRAVPTAVRVRVHQRRSRLQVHHVEAFAGHLLRAGVGAGILVTTGDYTADAAIVADAFGSPRLRLYRGSEWVRELASSRLGLRRRSLWRWILELPQSAAIRARRRRGGRR